jgi:hypothetical protein
MSLFGKSFGIFKKNLISNTFLCKLYPKHPLQALSQTSFLYNKHFLLVLLFYNLFILQLSMARWRQQLLDRIAQALEDKAVIDLMFVVMLL